MKWMKQTEIVDHWWIMKCSLTSCIRNENYSINVWEKSVKKEKIMEVIIIMERFSNVVSIEIKSETCLQT